MISYFPIQNGASSTSCNGPSSLRRPVSFSGLPILNLPPGMGSISRTAFECSIRSVYGFISEAEVAFASFISRTSSFLFDSLSPAKDMRSKNPLHVDAMNKTRAVRRELKLGRIFIIERETTWRGAGFQHFGNEQDPSDLRIRRDRWFVFSLDVAIWPCTPSRYSSRYRESECRLTRR